MREIPSGGASPLKSTEELNPLLNPILEQNLSRWAQVYFTTPPQARERAIRELLHELQAGKNPSAAPPPVQPVAPPVTASAVNPSHSDGETLIPAGVTCANCQSENAPGQQFCGFCGGPLDLPGVSEARIAAHAEQPTQRQETAPPDSSLPHMESLSFLGLDSNPADDRDLQFLREKSFGTEYYEPEAGSHRARYIVAIIIILAGIGYLEWPFLSSHLQSASRPPQASRQAPEVAGSGALPAIPPPPTEPQPSAGADAQPQTTAPAPVAQVQDENNKPSHDAHNPAESPQTAQPLTLASRTEAASSANADGTQELLQAQRYLDGRGVSHSSEAAAALLWKAVSKQNTQADLLLADLYLQGDGVSKSCDQARLLLSAAAKKNASGAADRLRRLESSGCR